MQDLDNCIMAVHECLEEYQGEGVPPRSYFDDLRAGMVDAVISKHCKDGIRGWQGFMEVCNLRSGRAAHGFWTPETVDEVLLKYVSETETPKLMPTQNQLREVKVLTQGLHQVTGMALCVAISVRGKMVLCESIQYAYVFAHNPQHWQHCTCAQI